MCGSKKHIVTIFILFILSFSTVYAQRNKSQLERQKKESIRKIKEAEKILNQTTSKKKNSIGELYAIQHQVKEMGNLIKSIKEELSIIDNDIDDTYEVVMSLESDFEQLKEEYAKMVYNTYKTTRGQTQLTFLFSSSTFNEFVMRLEYMEQYSVARRKQTEQISKVRDILSIQIDYLELHKVEKGDLLNEQLAESDKLKQLKSKQNEVINSLASREKEIKKQIDSNKKAVARLNTLINEFIKAEIAKSTKTRNSTALKMTPESAKLAESFAANKGKLPWPVESGFISKGYGRQQHPVWKHVVTENKGVDIQTNSSQEVRCVFEGEVTKVAHIPGLGKMVMIRHGDYFTVYTKLKDIHVQTGQKVSTKDSLGVVLTDNEGVSEVKFSVWKNSQSMNPKSWLYPR